MPRGFPPQRMREWTDVANKLAAPQHAALTQPEHWEGLTFDNPMTANKDTGGHQD